MEDEILTSIIIPLSLCHTSVQCQVTTTLFQSFLKVGRGMEVRCLPILSVVL